MRFVVPNVCKLERMAHIGVRASVASSHTPGTILIAADGTCYRAREPYENMHGHVVQPFTILYSDGSTSVFSCSGDVPGEASTIWEPSGAALPKQNA